MPLIESWTMPKAQASAASAASAAQSAAAAPRNSAAFRPIYARALQDFDSLPDSANVRLPVVAALHGVSTATVWRWSNSGKLPSPTRTGGVTAWNVGALRRAMAATA